MIQYLYAVSVSGIQSFIFETGKLKEIAGSSELVEQMCTELFEDLLGTLFKADKKLLGAAGKIQYLFDDPAQCEKVVLTFPKKIAEHLPGASISQAVLKIDGPLSTSHFYQLEDQLETQENQPAVSHQLGMMIAQRSQRTGAPATKSIREADDPSRQRLDAGQVARLAAVKQDTKGRMFRKFLSPEDLKQYQGHFPVEIEKLTGQAESSWIAVIHADGNSLGKQIQSVFSEVEKGKKHPLEKFIREFSQHLDEATKAAVKTAFERAVKPQYEKEKVATEEKGDPTPDLPLRPIILGGDDLTLIIRADYAIAFTEEFLRGFEAQTQSLFSTLAIKYGVQSLEKGLTACAGIAYIKQNYPFHYGVDLAESLCNHAKGVAKKLTNVNQLDQVPSALAFHKVQSSFVIDYDDIVERELSGGGKEQTIRMDFGPYFLQKSPSPEYGTISDLLRQVKAVNRTDAPHAGLREWLTEIKVDEARAAQLMSRIRQLNGKYATHLALNQPFPTKRWVKHRKTLEEYEARFTPIYDIVTLASLQKTAL